MNSRPGFGSILTAVAMFSLFALEVRLPLLDVRLQAFLGVIAREEELLQFALDAQRFAESNLRAGDDGALDAPHGSRSLVRRAELPSVSHHVIPECLALIDVVNQAEFQRFLEAERPAGS